MCKVVIGHIPNDQISPIYCICVQARIHGREMIWLVQRQDQGKLLAKRTRRERTEEGTEEGTDVETHAHRAN